MDADLGRNTPSYCAILDEVSNIVVRKASIQQKFHEGHAIALLIYLLKEEVVGRKKLSQKLSIGETSVRSLIKRLVKANFVKVDRVAGAVLTDKGRELAKKLSELIQVRVLGSDYLGFGWNNVVVVILSDTPPETTNVIVIRDKAIALNANAVLVSILNKGEILVPGIPREDPLYEKIRNDLISILGDIVWRKEYASILYASIRNNEPLAIAGYRLGFGILHHYCLRRMYC